MITKARVMVFWDYDTQWGAERSRGKGGPKPWGPLEFIHTERLLDLHAQYRVQACFAVVGAAALPGARPYHDPGQIRRIRASGHEVASHSFKHEWLPALSGPELIETLRSSKDALEQCTGEEVRTFVPPYNQPFDHLRKLSVSFSERVTAGRRRVTVRRMCDALRETGYRACRVAYRPVILKVADLVLRRPAFSRSEPEKIGGVLCVRQDAPAGFAETARLFLRRSLRAGSLVCVYGHPHSLSSDNDQNEKHLVRFLKEIADLRDRGSLDILLPGDLLQGT